MNVSLLLQARMSAKGLPQIAVVMGSCTAGGRLRPGHGRREHHRARQRNHLLRRASSCQGMAPQAGALSLGSQCTNTFSDTQLAHL